MKNNNFLMDSIDSSFEFNSITSLESNSFNKNQLFSSRIERNYFLNPNSFENTDSFSLEKSIKKRKHNKFAKDNIKRKIQVNYLKFLINFINQIIKELLSESANIEDFQFYRLDYKFAKDITKKSFNGNKEKTIGEIFKDNASSKYKNNKKINVKVYNRVTKNEIIKKILNKPYLYFFYIYYSGQTIINLSDYGLDKIINLSSNTGFCKDIITQNNDTETLERIYRNKILECIKKNFLTGNIPIFLTNKY